MTNTAANEPWYRGISRYQWLVLLIASLGWVFDVFEGQIFVASMNEAMKSLVPPGTSIGTIAKYNNYAFAAFLAGGALGGVFFGALSDRWGRVRTMSLTILVYSCFTCVTAFAETWWQMAILRFLVALGVGGEWAIAAAMVAEVFPPRARAWSGAIFHGSSVFGTYLAVAAGAFVVANPAFGWRWGFALGALPALLILWIRWRLREPEAWVRARQNMVDRPRENQLVALFNSEYARLALLGVALAATGLATFWGVHIYGKDLLRQHAQQVALSVEGDEADNTEQSREAVLKRHAAPIKHAEMLGMLLVTTGGGLGLLAFGPVSERFGRRAAFTLFQIGGFVVAILLFRTMTGASAPALYVALPVFGFLTLGTHAGYAIYFPELFPTRLRGTGAGFCFNVGRLVAAPIMIVTGWLQEQQGWRFDESASALSVLFLVGAMLVWFGPETRGRALPEETGH